MKEINGTFKHYTITEFNKAYRTELTGSMEVEELTNYLEEVDINYLYCSFSDGDVLREYREFYAENEHECDLVCINGLYLALY